MNNELISNINVKVRTNDEIWILGDFCFHNKNHNVAKYFLDQINCKNVYLIYGNHDDRRIGSFFKKAYDLYDYKYNYRSFVFCHYALAVWNKSHRGTICCYGHSHSSAEKFLDEKFPERKSMDVGVDNAKLILNSYSPFSLDEVIKIMDNKKG